MKMKIVAQSRYTGNIIDENQLLNKFEKRVNSEIDEIEKSGVVIDIREMTKENDRAVMLLYVEDNEYDRK